MKNLFILCLLIVVSGVSCSRTQTPPPLAPEVGVVTIAPESVALTTELPGRIDPVRVAEVRARVTGIVLHREFIEGAEVKAGEVLFQIDPAPFQADYDSAAAALAKAEANLKQAQALADRYQSLVGINAVSKQDYDNAVSAAAQAQADVLAAKAALETASLNLGYATVTSPIDGRIGAALVTEGALVSQSAATEMAVVQQLDPIYCDFTESSTEVLRLRRELEGGALKSRRARRGEGDVVAGRRDDLPASRQTVVFRRHGGPEQRHDHPAGRVSQSRPFAPAGDVCAGIAGTGG